MAVINISPGAVKISIFFHAFTSDILKEQIKELSKLFLTSKTEQIEIKRKNVKFSKVQLYILYP